MPLNVRRLFASVSLVVFSFLISNAQQQVPQPQMQPQSTPPTTAPTTAPTSGEVMRARVSKAKGFIAVKNYNAAIYELENIRRETNDQTVHGVLNVLLMNCYLEQGDYKRAQDFLATLFNDIKSNKPNAAANYYAAAGQIIKGARNQSERYKALGLTVSDRNLPPEAAGDLENMRATLEKVVDQSRTLGKDAKQTANAMVLLEETSNARSILARDDYDAKRWKDEVADSRETLANSRSTILNAVNDGVTETANLSNTAIAATNPTSTLPTPETTTNQPTSTFFKPVSENKPSTDVTAKNDKPVVNEPVKKEEPKKTEETPRTVPPANLAENTNQPKRERRVASQEETKEVKNEAKPSETPAKTTDAAVAKTETVDNTSPLSVGSLIEFAVQKTNPVYPPVARNMRQTGVVRMEVTVDEEGKVASVQNLSGPSLLQSAAKDAIKKWKFKPFVRDGQPVKATGFISFNFAL